MTRDEFKQIAKELRFFGIPEKEGESWYVWFKDYDLEIMKRAVQKLQEIWTPFDELRPIDLEDMCKEIKFGERKQEKEEQIEVLESPSRDIMILIENGEYERWAIKEGVHEIILQRIREEFNLPSDWGTIEGYIKRFGRRC